MQITTDIKVNSHNPQSHDFVAQDGKTGKRICLTDLLDAKENRSKTQKRLLKTFKKTLVCLSVNYVGDVKSNDITKTIFNQGARAIVDSFTVGYYCINLLSTGEEGFFVVDYDATTAKKLVAKIETTHPLGRFMDIDVFDQDGAQISRQQINQPPRKCLLCERDARECYLLRSHTPKQLKDFIDDAVLDFNKTKEHQKTKDDKQI